MRCICVFGLMLGLIVFPGCGGGPPSAPPTTPQDDPPPPPIPEDPQPPRYCDAVQVSLNLDIFDVVRDPDLWDLDRFTDEVDEMMCASAEAGVTRILYRVTACGEVMYPSEVVTPFNGTVWGPDGGTVYSDRTTRVVSGLAPLSECVRAAHKYGLQLWAWINLFDRGYGPAQLWDQWLHDHPELWWRHRDAEAYSFHEVWFGMPCNAYPQVRAHQAAEVAELVSRYPIDGLFFDFRKHGGATGNGNLDNGYNEPVIAEYVRRWGRDPREDVVAEDAEAFRRFSLLKAEYTTELIRDLRDASAGLPIMLMYGEQTAEPLTWLAYVNAMAITEDALVDEICLWRQRPDQADANTTGLLPYCQWSRIYDWGGEWTREQKASAICAAVESAVAQGVEGVTLHEQVHFERDEFLYSALGTVLLEPL